MRIATQRLKACLREGDQVARLGGDEFAILLEGIRSDTDVERIAVPITEAFNRPLLVDGRETDATASIAEAHGARVIRKEWLGYGRQKQFAVSAAAHDWVLCLDADERLSPELADSIRAAMAGPPAATAFRAARRNRFLGRWLRHGEGYPDWNLRLFDRRHARWTEDPVHEHVVADGKVARLAGRGPMRPRWPAPLARLSPPPTPCRISSTR